MAQERDHLRSAGAHLLDRALLFPLVVLVPFLVIGGWVGVVVHGGVILTWALRDLWQEDR